MSSDGNGQNSGVQRRMNTILGHLTASAPQSSEQQRPKVTGHWIGTQPILPTPSMSEEQRSYLMETNMNMSHQSLDQFASRAKAFAKDITMERRILHHTQQALQDHTSDEFQQSSHMIHTQRGDIWARRQQQAQQLQPDAYNVQVGQDLQRATTSRRQGKNDDPHYDSLMDLMVSGKQGPLTLEQSQLGVEAVAAGHQVFRRQRDAESENQYSATRVAATGRKGHPTQSDTGVDLSQDPMSQDRDKAGRSVFMGTSGSTSDVVRSHHAATTNVQQQLSPMTTFAAPGLNDQRANLATANLALRWMRAGGPAQNVSAAIDTKLNQLGQRISHGPLDSTQTHTVSEIDTAVVQTRKVLQPRPQVQPKTEPQEKPIKSNL